MKTLLALLLLLFLAVNISAQSYDYTYIEVTPSFTSGNWGEQKLTTTVNVNVKLNVALGFTSIKLFYNTQAYEFRPQIGIAEPSSEISLQNYGIGLRFNFGDRH